MGIIIPVAILVFLVVVYISVYNSFIRFKTWIEEAWSQIDVQLKRRNDLIPNLVSTAKGYMKMQEDTLTKVTELRSQLMQTSDHAQAMDVSNQLTGALKTIFALSEDYPELKGNEQFTKLSEELSYTENKIAYARQLYNSTVGKYNIKVKTVPSNIVASIHGFMPEVFLATPEEERAVPKVEF
jgi:LemA protein